MCVGWCVRAGLWNITVSCLTFDNRQVCVLEAIPTPFFLCIYQRYPKALLLYWFLNEVGVWRPTCECQKRNTQLFLFFRNAVFHAHLKVALPCAKEITYFLTWCHEVKKLCFCVGDCLRVTTTKTLHSLTAIIYKWQRVFVNLCRKKNVSQSVIFWKLQRFKGIKSRIEFNMFHICPLIWRWVRRQWPSLRIKFSFLTFFEKYRLNKHDICLLLLPVLMLS